MKILSMNIHSLIEPDCGRKMKQFAQMIETELPDVFGLQEVSQTGAEREVEPDQQSGYCTPSDLDPVIRRDNYALCLASLLRQAGCPYYWTWIPVKIGYDIYEEGLALFSRYSITEISQFYISGIQDFENWKTRKTLGIRVKELGNQWFYSVHMGWWDDQEEPFAEQWNRIMERQKNKEQPVWFLGDFNAPSQIRGEGYDYVCQSGWKDTYELAVSKDSGITVSHVIDGWKERMSSLEQDSLQKVPGVRIDYIWTDRELDIRESRVICNGTEYPVVSDHYGVIAEV